MEVVEEPVDAEEPEEAQEQQSDGDEGGEGQVEGSPPARAAKRQKKSEGGTLSARAFFEHVKLLPAFSQDDISEYCSLGKLVGSMVPGSVEEERMFSAMKFLKNAQRNRLTPENLTICARLFKSKGTEVPLRAAMEKWLDAKARYGMARP